MRVGGSWYHEDTGYKLPHLLSVRNMTTGQKVEALHGFYINLHFHILRTVEDIFTYNNHAYPDGWYSIASC